MIDYSKFEAEDSDTPSVDIPLSSIDRLHERYNAGALNPDLYAKSKALSSATGLPETVVARNMPDAERRAAEPDWLVFESQAPDTAKRLADDVDFFNLAHDDTENLSFWEKTLRTAREMKTDAVQGYQAGKLQNDLGIVGSNAMFSQMAPETRQRAQELNARIESLKGSGGFVEAAAKIIGQMSESVPDAVQSGSVYGSAAGLATMAAGPEVSIPAAIGGFAAGAGASMAANSYRVEAGHMYLDMIESGVDEGIASVSAAGGGIINAALETAGFSMVAAPVKQAFTKLATDALTKRLTASTTSTAVKNFARNYALAYGGEVGTEILQEVVAVTAEEIAKAVDPKDLESMLTTEEGRAQISARLEGTAAEVMKGMALLALPGASVDFVVDTRKAAQARKNVELLGAIGEQAKASKVLPRDMNAFEQHLAQLAKDGPTDTVYVNAKDFFNAVAATGKDPNKVVQEIPSLRDQWQEAQTLDADLVMPLSEFAARIAPTDLHDALVPHLKFSQDQTTAAQAQKATQERAQTLREQAAQVAAEQTDVAAWEESSESVFNAVRKQLTQAGRYSDSANRAQATLIRDFYAVMAGRVGITPGELWQRQPLSIDGQLPGGAVLNQFAGENALTADLSALNTARQQIAEGMDAEQVRQSTGWHQGVDGKWRFEIDDSAARFKGYDPQTDTEEVTSTNPDAFVDWVEEAKARENGVPLSQALHHPALFQAYPRLGAARIVVDENQKGGVFFEGGNGRIVIGDPYDYAGGVGEALRVVLHEIQHAIQTREGFASGGNPEAMAVEKMKAKNEWDYWSTVAAIRQEAERTDGSIDKAAETIADLFDVEVDQEMKIQALNAKSLEALNKKADAAQRKLADFANPLQTYKNLAGEIEARNTEARAGMDAEQRRTTSPESTADVSSNAAIIVWNGKEMAAAQNPNILTQSAFHGSPHKFDKFTTDRIGSGEGTQAYGWGLYFAGDKQVAEWYREQLSGIDKGQLYEVSIPDDGAYGLWDVPLSKQPEVVKNAIRKIVDTKFGDGTFDAYAEDGNDWNDLTDNLLEDVTDEELSRALNAEGVTGIKYLDGSSRGTGKESYNYVIFDDEAIRVLNTFYQNNQQQARGTFDPAAFNISLLQTADFSTFLHETGHFFFEMMGNLARDADAQSPLRADMDTLLQWIGVEGATPDERLGKWLSMPLNERRAGHEKFAESFEQYLFEGKAPNAELQTLFARFSQWLKMVYKSLSEFMQTHNGAQLTDDVRGVMDRMIATDAQIEFARRRASATPMPGIESALTSAEYQAYVDANNDAVAVAQRDLEQRSLRDMQWLRNAMSKALKALQNKAKDVRKATRTIVEQEMLREQVYAADRFIRYGTHQADKLTNAQRKAMDSLAGGSTKLSLDALKAMYGDGPAAQWRYLAKGKYGLAATDGMHPDILATALGYKSGDALVRALLSATPFNEELDARTDQRMLEEHGELVDENAMRKAADAAVHNQARTRVLATELTALQRLAKAAGFSVTAAREYATRIIDNAKVKDLRASKYSTAEARAAKDSEQLFKKGDRIGAAAAKFRQVLNHFAVIKAANAQNEIDAARRQFAKMFKKRADVAKGRDADIVAAAQAILARYALAPANKDPGEYLSSVAQYAPEFAADLASIIANTPDPKPWDRLTVAEFLAMRDAVLSLWTMAKRAKEIEVDGRRVSLDQAVADLFNEADIGDTDNRVGLTRDVIETDKVRMLAYGARAAMRRVESWVDMMDNGNPAGPFRRFLFTPLREAVDRYRLAKRDVMQRYADLVKTIEAGLTFTTIDAPELGYQFTGGKASIIGAMLHTGNESNLQKLLRGRGWGEFREDGTLDTSKWAAFMQRMTDEGVITRTDWEFVQGVWDLLEELKPLAQTAHHDMYGYYFDEVQASEIVTPFGRFRGGYFPAMADPASSASAMQFEDADAMLHGQNSFMLPTTGRGFTKARTAAARPLVMDLRATTQHIDKLLRFVHIEPRMKDTYRIVRHPVFKDMADRINPQLINSMLLPWMQRTAQQITGQPGADFLSRHFGKLLNKLRTRTGLNMMVLNIVNALQQVTGFSMAAVKVGPGNLNGALWRYMQNSTELSAMIDAKSNFMQTRTSSQAMEISNEIELILNPTKLQTAKAFAERHGYFLQQTLQNFIDRVVWLGAYDQATAQGLDDTTSVRQADAAVRQTQGSFNAEDISRVEAGSPLSRLFTMFYSYFNMQSNLLATEFAKAFKADGLISGRALYVYAMGFMVPAVVAELIAGVARGEIDDEDDDGYLDEFLALFFNSQARTLSAMLPYVNVLTTAGLAKYDGKWYNDRISASPAVSTLDAAVSTATLPFDVMFTDKEINGIKAARDFFTTLGLITGLPAGVINRPIGWIDQATSDK